MSKLIFLLFIFNGKIEKSNDLYTIHTETATYENACEGEALNWIKTGKFEYNDFLCQCGELE